MNRKTLIILIVSFVLGMAADVADVPGLACLAGIEYAQAATKSRNKKRSTKAFSKRKTTRKSTGKKTRRKNGKGTTRKKRTTAVKRTPAPKPEQPMNDSLTLLVNDRVLSMIPREMNPGGLRVNSVKPDSRSRSARIGLNENFTYLPVTQDLIKELTKEVKSALPDSLDGYRIDLKVGDRNLAYYITKVDKLPADRRVNPSFVKELSQPWTAKKGMAGDVVAMWHSHGRYYKNGSWQWQRPLIFETVEDLFPTSYILNYAVPMIENAGGYVMLPRERDLNREEVIVDNDTNPDGAIYSQTTYKEKTGSQPWTTGELEGFIYDLPDFRDTENPFENGTYRQTKTVASGSPSVAAWYADIPHDGEYAVYVSYKTLPESTKDARYTVNYSGGSREFSVNQTMGGGTWIYLGTFPLEAGYSDTEPVVTLTNVSGDSGKILTADAVKIGGGMGNIARSPRRSDLLYDPSTPVETSASNTKTQIKDDEEVEEDDEEGVDEEEDDEEEIDDESDETPDVEEPAAPAAPAPTTAKGPAPTFRTSGMPRFAEGARYWLHWAGAPETVYSPYHGTDDYKDDYTSRGHWVNWLAGGSKALPNKKGLGIPVDAVMALHTDAGKRSDDSFVGTLGIYYTNNGDSYQDGTPRINSRMLTDMLMRQITGDIRQTWEPSWTRRSMWDKSYVEARVPEVPTALIELMSHQNFADMQYGLDPRFQFTVGRSIYKAMARFLSERKDRELVIQPLPVKDFAIERTKKNHYRLTWEPVEDKLEPTAKPTHYLIYERSGDELGFHFLGQTHSTHYDIATTDHEIHSFQVVAANDGGVSFPSETLAFREGEGSEKPVLIINGFDRVSAPMSFKEGDRAGFDSEKDFGVPYIKDVQFTGHQTEFRRSAGESFGRSGDNYAPRIIAGNTFDYPYLHGEAFAKAGRGFISTSLGAVEKGDVKLSDYKTVDLILGKQKATVTGRGRNGAEFVLYPEKLQKSLKTFLKDGGRLIVSGEYVTAATDSVIYPEGVDFAVDVLGVERDGNVSRPRNGKIETALKAVGMGFGDRTYKYSNTLNDAQYIVENPDPLKIVDNGKIILNITDSNAPAGVMTEYGRGRSAVFSVPLESLTDPNQRALLVKETLKALEN